MDFNHCHHQSWQRRWEEYSLLWKWRLERDQVPQLLKICLLSEVQEMQIMENVGDNWVLSLEISHLNFTCVIYFDIIFLSCLFYSSCFIYYNSSEIGMTSSNLLREAGKLCGCLGVSFHQFLSFTSYSSPIEDLPYHSAWWLQSCCK